MTLDNLVQIGKLKPHAADKAEIARLLAGAERALADAVARECRADARKIVDDVRAWLATNRRDLT